MKQVNRTKEELIQLRSSFLTYPDAEKVQKELIAIYKKEYKPKHSAKVYLKLILDEEVSEIEERHEQSNNWPDKVYETFSIVSQHVYGYTKEHCLDQIYDAVQLKKKRINLYKTLPTLKELIDSKKRIFKNIQYYFREKLDHPDSCYGYSGDIILRMREVGIEETQSEMFKEINKMFFTNETT